MNKFKERLRELMKENGDNTVTLSKKLGISSQAISLWFSTDREPRVSVLCNISTLYKIDINFLLGITDVY